EFASSTILYALLINNFSNEFGKETDFSKCFRKADPLTLTKGTGNPVSGHGQAEEKISPLLLAWSETTKKILELAGFIKLDGKDDYLGLNKELLDWPRYFVNKDNVVEVNRKNAFRLQWVFGILYDSLSRMGKNKEEVDELRSKNGFLNVILPRFGSEGERSIIRLQKFLRSCSKTNGFLDGVEKIHWTNIAQISGIQENRDQVWEYEQYISRINGDYPKNASFLQFKKDHHIKIDMEKCYREVFCGNSDKTSKDQLSEIASLIFMPINLR
ncbi:MAG: hypothetical protein Q8P97_00575, partial [bacterium]|nr:hypothetical protein [bacterium]